MGPFAILGLFGLDFLSFYGLSGLYVVWYVSCGVERTFLEPEVTRSIVEQEKSIPLIVPG